MGKGVVNCCASTFTQIIENMKKTPFITLCLIPLFIFSNCGRDDLPIIKEKPVEEFSPVSVTKTNPMKLYVHYMPWFESKASNNGTWGQHWTMANKNPDNTDAKGKREIASHYYPLIGPYASGDENVIEYHLLLMKYSGVDGILIDWNGTRNLYDYPSIKNNTEAIVKVLDKVGLNFAIVYEDQSLKEGLQDAEKITQAKADMKYLESTFFSKENYIKINNKPLLMVFGPQEIKKPADWSSIFSVLKTKPTFLTLYAHSAGTANEGDIKNAEGEYIWVDATPMETKYAGKDVLMGGAYPGFNDFYKEGGWGESVLADIDYANGATFKNLLAIAKDKKADYLQLITWNDFGEGTMIEPTQEFKYSYLTELQGFAGVSYNVSVLENIYKLHSLRETYKNDVKKLRTLNQAFYYFVSLQNDKAKSLIEEVEATK